MKLLVFIFIISFNNLLAQTITTVAGGVPSKGDGGLAINAQVSAIYGLAVDKDGNLFISDTYSFTIRKLNISTGIITTVAGNGTPGYSGDGGLATRAQLLEPYAFGIDPLGNIYIVDVVNNVIRKVDAKTGIITRFAGTGKMGYAGDNGLATQALFNFSSPGGIAIDDIGNVFISDGANSIIRKVDADGIITTVAGTNISGFSGDGGPPLNAQFQLPMGLAFDNAGNLLACDFWDHRIRRIDFTKNIITTIAGNGLAGSLEENVDAKQATLFGPVNLTVLPNGDIYLTESGDSPRIRKIEASSGLIMTAVGGGTNTDENIPLTTASISSPTGIASFGNNNLYIGIYIGRVYLADLAKNNLNTIAGEGRFPFSGDDGPATKAQLTPSSIAMNKSHELFVIDYNNARIRKVDTETGIITTVAGTGKAGYTADGGPATKADISTINGRIIVDVVGNFFFSDANSVVRRVDGATGVIQTIAGNGTIGDSGDGGPATSAQLQYPLGVAIDASGNLFIADEFNHRIRRVEAITNIISTWAGTGTSGFSGDGGLATSAQVSFPQDVVCGKNGDLFFTDAGNFRVRKIDGATGIITTVAGNGKLNYIREYTGDGGLAVDASLIAQSLAVDSVGDLYIAAPFAQKILKVTFSTGIISTVAGTGEAGFAGENGPALKARLYSPMSLAFDGSELYVADFNTNRVRKITGLSVDQAAKETDVIVYNGVSPNGDGKNEIFYLENILSSTAKYNTVSIFNRWEDVVWRGNNYDNTTTYFNGTNLSGEKLPSGIYFYRIDFESGKKPLVGYLALRR